ncbi:MAG: ATP-binding protein [Acetobacteraceae bacterium]
MRLPHEREQVAISVVDQGSGITDGFVRGGLFRPFTSTKSAGFGLGAFQARALLREAGGDLTLTSVLAEGTTMRIVLPVLPARDTHTHSVGALGLNHRLGATDDQATDADCGG